MIKDVDPAPVHKPRDIAESSFDVIERCIQILPHGSAPYGHYHKLMTKHTVLSSLLTLSSILVVPLVTSCTDENSDIIENDSELTANVSTPGAQSFAPFSAALVGKFAFVACPVGPWGPPPTGTACLVDDISGTANNNIGSISNHKLLVIIDPAGSDGCNAVRKSGPLVTTDGSRLNIFAWGRFCASTFVAKYNYVIMGGTGRFSHTVGQGTWDVPAPDSFDGAKGVGKEYISGVIALDGRRP